MPILDLFEVTKAYGKFSALKALSLQLYRGNVHGLLGPNGSGKSTTLHAISGLLSPTSGEVAICGLSIASKESRNHFGFAPDDMPLPETLTGSEYLAFHRTMRSTAFKQRTGDIEAQLTEALEIDDVLDKIVGEYSHGMKRKIQLVAALSHEPELLILDEPYRGLDPDASVVLQGIIANYSRAGNAIIIATHDMIRAERDCTHVTILSKGRSVASGSPSELKNELSAANLEEVFLMHTEHSESVQERVNQVRNIFSGSTKTLGTP